MNWKASPRFKSMGVILALAMMTVPVGYEAAAGGGNLIVQNIDLILTDAGYIAGTLIGDIGKEVRVYRGIPYAAPPLGDNRWKPPQPVTPWTGIRECTKFSLMPPQKFPTPPLYGNIPESGMGEDCLYLNVYTPAKKRTDRLPVMVWLHGGGFDGASGNDFSWNREYLPQHDVVLVLVNARLGPLGYMAHPLLSAESENGASGNYGQLDQIAALRWVQKNIAAFGGDPDNVTIFGESGGGAKVRWLMASPLARGLFHRAIVQSGAIKSGAGGIPRVELPLKDAEQLGEKLATQLSVSTLAELRVKSWQEVITAALALGSGYRTVMTVDGWSLLDELNHVFQAGRQTDVPFMIGATEADIPPLFTGTQDLVATMKFKSKTYVFMFAHVPRGWKSKGVKAGHGFDVAYLFHHLELLPIFLGRSVPSSAGPDPGFDEKDEYVAEAVMALWAKFAKTGNPSIEGLITWPPYEYATDQYLKIDYPLEVLSGFSKLKQSAPVHVRRLPLEGAANFRDLGGYITSDGRTVKWGLVYRSSHLGDLTAADYRYLNAFGIKLVCDLRTDGERQRMPTKWQGSAPEIMSVSLLPEREVVLSPERLRELATPHAGTLAAAYDRLVVESAERYGQIMRRLASGDLPAVTHCTGGKDRTGVFAALLLTILGAPLDVVVQDYMLTGEYMASDENLRRARADFQKLAGGSEPPDLETMRRLNATEPEAIIGIFDTIARHYGSFDAFVRNGMKLTDAEVASLKERLLE